MTTRTIFNCQNGRKPERATAHQSWLRTPMAPMKQQGWKSNNRRKLNKCNKINNKNNDSEKTAASTNQYKLQIS